MRKSREDAAATRSAIVTAASRLFRSEGIAAVSVADVMGSLGLTVGGFYRHFESKDALAAEAVDLASQETTAALSAVRDRAARGARRQAIVDFYLSRTHVRNRAHGCPVAAFAGEVPHCAEVVKRAFADAHARLAGVIAGTGDDVAATPKSEDFRAVATLVGALLLARALDDGARAGELPKNVLRSPARTRVSRARSRPR